MGFFKKGSRFFLGFMWLIRFGFIVLVLLVLGVGAGGSFRRRLCFLSFSIIFCFGSSGMDLFFEGGSRRTWWDGGSLFEGGLVVVENCWSCWGCWGQSIY